MERSRENLKGRVALSLESTGARMGRLGSSLLAEMPVLSLQETFARIEGVHAEDVRELAASLFAPGALSLACIGPDEALFTAALRPLERSARILA
jgi:predicted Zn-dependent peptidase